jgi:anthranilate synthase/indole-3-glycerol phosphate synthase/phosphoribosylanthranilate isomerase
LLRIPDVQKVLESDDGLRIILAGGLDPTNVVESVQKLGSLARKVVGVDVSSGVETNGSQDLIKIRAFVEAVKNIQG